MSPGDRAVDTVLAYHRRAKHHLHRYAASPESLDWATQPDPFRTFGGAERVDLPLRADRPLCADWGRRQGRSVGGWDRNW